MAQLSCAKTILYKIFIYHLAIKLSRSAIAKRMTFGLIANFKSKIRLEKLAEHLHHQTFGKIQNLK